MGISNYKSTPLSAMKILKESIKLPAKNLNLIHPILILSFLCSSFYFLFNYFSLTPLLTNISTSSLAFATKTETNSSESSALFVSMIKNLKEFYIIGFLSLTLSFIINSLLSIAKIHILSTAYSTNNNNKTPSTLKEVMSTINCSLIKRSMITQLYVALFTIGYVASLVLPAGVLSAFYINTEKKILITGLGVIVALVAFLLYMYLTMVWMMGVVISVVEEGCYGLEGIAKAGKLLRGRRRNAILVVFMELFAVGVISEVYRFSMGYVPSNKMAGLGVGVGRLVVGVVCSLFIWSVHTVYYYECNKIDSEEIAMNGGFMYTPVANLVDEAYP